MLSNNATVTLKCWFTLVRRYFIICSISVMYGQRWSATSRNWNCMWTVLLYNSYSVEHPDLAQVTNLRFKDSWTVKRYFQSWPILAFSSEYWLSFSPSHTWYLRCILFLRMLKHWKLTPKFWRNYCQQGSERLSSHLGRQSPRTTPMLVKRTEKSVTFNSFNDMEQHRVLVRNSVSRA